MPRFKNPEEKRDFMLTTPIPRLVTSMALPSIAAMIITSLYNLADTFFVSKLGTSATGAVGVNGSIDTIIMMASSLFAAGSASYTARLLGAGRVQRAREVLSTCYFATVIMGVLVTILGFSFTDPMLRLLGANEEVLPYSREYCSYILLAVPFMTSSFVLNQNLRAEGSSLYSMIGMVTGAVLNIGLDPLFIFGLGWGVAGASAATALSKLVSWIILMTPYLRKQTVLTIKLRQFRPRWADAKDVCSMGSASFFRGGLSALAAIVLNRLASGYSTSALAAISVSNRIIMFLTSACLGFGQGFQPVAGFSWGAGRFDRVRKSYYFAQAACVAGISVISLVVFVFARQLLLLFTEGNEEMLRIGVYSLRIQCAAMPLHGGCIIVNMLCAGLGRPVSSVFLGIGRQGLFFYPLLPVMVHFFGVWGVASIQAVADVLNACMAAPIAVHVMREIIQREKEANGALPQQIAVS